MASSSSSSPMKYQVFLSFRGGDTRLNFTSHLLKALKDTAMNVFFDELELERGEPLSSALSSAISASNLSIIVLSKDYASSKSCLAEVSDIMSRKESQGYIVLPIFYHVDPSDVRNIGDSFKGSFDFHESKGLPQLQQWKDAFAQVGQLKGWHIQGGLSDRSETEYIKDVVEYVIQKLNSKSKSISEELIGIDDQKNMIMRLIDQQDIRVIGLWGMGGRGKTTLAEAVYNEISQNFEARCFVQNVREKIEKQGKESVRDDLISKLLNSATCIDTPSIGSSITRDRLNNTRVILVLDDVDDSDQIVDMGIKHFGPGSKIMVTSRDKQELENGGADKIHKVEMLNENDSLQLFSTFAFKQLNPPVEFRDLSYTFLEYAQGSPLALKVLGSTLYGKSRGVWESEVFKLKEYAKPKIAQVLRRSYYGLDDLEKNIFLDIAILYKGKKREEIEAVRKLDVQETQIEELSKLPPYLRNLNAISCTWLEKVSFADQNLYPSDLLDHGKILMLFPGCISLNKDSVDNIETNDMLKIGSLAEIWSRKYFDRSREFCCCFPGDVIAENKFEYRSVNSSLNFKIVPNRFGGNRFLGFAICLAVDFSDDKNLVCAKSECQLTATGGGGGGYVKFTCELIPKKTVGDNVLILFSEKMFIKEKDYDEAFFRFHFTDYCGKVLDDVKVKKCGIHVIYKDAKRDLDAATEITPNQYEYKSSFSYVGDVGHD